MWTPASSPLTKSQKLTEWKHWGSVQVQVPRFANSKTPACKLSVRVRVHENRKRKMDKENWKTQKKWNIVKWQKWFKNVIMFYHVLSMFHVFFKVCRFCRFRSKLAKLSHQSHQTHGSTKVLSASLPGLPAPGNFTRSRQRTQWEKIRMKRLKWKNYSKRQEMTRIKIEEKTRMDDEWMNGWNSIKFCKWFRISWVALRVRVSELAKP